MLKFFEEMSKDGIKPDRFLFDTLVNAFGKSVRIFQVVNDLPKGDIQNMLKCLDKMRESKILPSVVTFNSIINAYGKIKDLHKMQNIFNLMATDPKTQPNEITFNTMINACGAAGLSPFT
jgi:pentatricopeptide repeat protein